MIEGVTFDWWNTVAVTSEDQDRRLRELRIERALRAMAGLPVTRDDLLRAYDRQTALLQETWTRNVDLRAEEQIGAFLAFAGLGGADTDVGRSLSEAFGGALLEIPPALFPHIPETLEALTADGLAIGLVSNTGRTWGRYLRKVQDRLGIGRFFDVRVFSDEVGVRKPGPAIFRAALEGLRLSPERVAHVGDDVDADVAGAKGLGMRAVWFNTGHWRNATTDRADAEIRDHAELPRVLEGWTR